MKKILISVALIIFLVSLFALSSCQDPSPSEIKVTFDRNDGTGVNDSVIIEAGATVEDWPRLKREGYSFDGWYLEEGFGGKRVIGVLAGEKGTPEKYNGYYLRLEDETLYFVMSETTLTLYGRFTPSGEGGGV